MQQRLGTGGGPTESVNLAIGATDPRSYYFRIRDVAVELEPDAVLLFIYAGNDFMAARPGLHDVAEAGRRIARRIAGGRSIMPRTPTG